MELDAMKDDAPASKSADRKSWTYDEFAQTGLDFADPAEVEAYDRRQGDRDTPNVCLLEELRVKSGDIVVDLGTGTGSLAIAAPRKGACRRRVAAHARTCSRQDSRRRPRRHRVSSRGVPDLSASAANGGFRL